MPPKISISKTKVCSPVSPVCPRYLIPKYNSPKDSNTINRPSSTATLDSDAISHDSGSLLGLALSVAIAIVTKSIKKMTSRAPVIYCPVIRNAKTTKSTISKVLIILFRIYVEIRWCICLPVLTEVIKLEF